MSNLKSHLTWHERRGEKSRERWEGKCHDHRSEKGVTRHHRGQKDAGRGSTSEAGETRGHQRRTLDQRKLESVCSSHSPVSLYVGVTTFRMLCAFSSTRGRHFTSPVSSRSSPSRASMYCICTQQQGWRKHRDPLLSTAIQVKVPQVQKYYQQNVVKVLTLQWNVSCGWCLTLTLFNF